MAQVLNLQLNIYIRKFLKLEPTDSLVSLLKSLLLLFLDSFWHCTLQKLENNKFINLTFQDKIYTTENINIEYIQNTDPTFAITETLYNNPLTNFQHVLDAPFITSKVINRDNSNNIVITFNEDIDYNIAIKNNVNISFNYKSTISGSDTSIKCEKDISKNIITFTPNATVPLDLTNNYKYIVRYRQVTDNDYNLKNNNNNKVNNFSVEFDFLNISS